MGECLISCDLKHVKFLYFDIVHANFIIFWVWNYLLQCVSAKKNMLLNGIDKAFYMDFVALSIPFPITIWIFLKRKYPRLYIQFCESALLTCSALLPSIDCKWWYTLNVKSFGCTSFQAITFSENYNVQTTVYADIVTSVSKQNISYNSTY